MPPYPQHTYIDKGGLALSGLEISKTKIIKFSQFITAIKIVNYYRLSVNFYFVRNLQIKLFETKHINRDTSHLIIIGSFDFCQSPPNFILCNGFRKLDVPNIRYFISFKVLLYLRASDDFIRFALIYQRISTCCTFC